MEPPVNLDNLRTITGGDPHVEAVVFAAFLDEAQSCLDKLQAALAAGDESQWRQQAHAFKGGCLNLGAGLLSALCGHAQMDWRASEEEKTEMLQSMHDEFARVRSALAEASQQPAHAIEPL